MHVTSSLAADERAEAAAFRRYAEESVMVMANDMQAIMALAEEAMLRWDAHGWLDRTTYAPAVYVAGRYVKERMPDMSALAAASEYAGRVKEVLEDARSAIALELFDEAGR